ERGEDEVAGIDEVDLPAARAGLLQARFELLLEEFGLLLGVFGGRGRRRYRGGGDLARLEAQAEQETPNLGGTPTDASALLDGILGLFDGAWRVLSEVLFQRWAMLLKGTARTGPGAAADLRQATFEILVEVALHAAARNAS